MRYNLMEVQAFHIAIECKTQEELDQFQDFTNIHNDPEFDNFKEGDCFLTYRAFNGDSKVRKGTRDGFEKDGFDVLEAQKQFALPRLARRNRPGEKIALFDFGHNNG